MNCAPINHFDRSKPFYPLVVNYIIQLHGVKELAVRGMIGPRRVDEELSKLIPDKIKSIVLTEVKDISTGITKILGPLELRSEFQDNRITADADEICKELANNISYLLPYYFKATGVLILLAHEITKGRSFNDKGPLLEFLRHCRNAVGHNGLFYFKKHEPSRPAHWGPFIIERHLQGTPLFKNEQGFGMLSPGDPIRLLWDIEQEYPNMRT